MVELGQVIGSEALRGSTWLCKLSESERTASIIRLASTGDWHGGVVSSNKRTRLTGD